MQLRTSLVSAVESPWRTTSSVVLDVSLRVNLRAGKYPTYFRAPYTDCTAESGCLADVKALGYHLVHYDLNSEDDLHPHRDHIQLSKDIVQEVISKAPENGSLLALQHDIIPPSISNLTAFTLELIKDKGWKGTSNTSSLPCALYITLKTTSCEPY